MMPSMRNVDGDKEATADELAALFGAPAMQAAENVPRFVHHNLEASRLVGLPDSPVIHLAVSMVYDLLLPSAAGAPISLERVHIQAMRAASGCVLFSSAIEEARELFRDSVGLQMDASVFEPERRRPRVNWLKLARQQMLADGDDPGPDVSRCSTAYGWNVPT